MLQRLTPGRCVCFVAAVVLVLMVTATSSAQYTEPNSYLNPSVTVTLGTAEYSTSLPNDTNVFQQAIDDVAAAGGGKVIVPRGTYEIATVHLKSNVHVVFDGHSTISINTTGISPTANLSLFQMGEAGRVDNVSVRSINSLTRFKLDRAVHRRVRAFRVADANNFLISNFDLADTRTSFSGISLGWESQFGDNPDGTARIATAGTVEHFRSSNAHYGYGAIQAQGSRSVLFKDIESIGGVALRLETGFKLLNEALARGDRMESSIDNVTAEGLSSYQGQGALLFSPHGMHQGSISAQNVESFGSEYAVLVEDGSLHRFTAEEIIDLDLTEGTWESIAIDGVDATFTAGPIETRWVHLNDYPGERHRNGTDPSVYRLPDTPAFYAHPYRGPSIAPVTNAFLGDPTVSITNINSHGFSYSPDQISDPFPASVRRQVTIAGTPLAGRLLGDINDDEIWTSEDLDLLFDGLGTVTQGGAYDLVNSDGIANMDDVAYWLRNIMGTEYGDADLDGRVSFLDIERIAANFNQAGDWADGDFNNDAIVDQLDLDILEDFYAPHEADAQLTFQEAVTLAGLTSAPVLLGDCNLDRVVNFLDIPHFIASLTSGIHQAEADIDENGTVNFLDIPPFIAILSVN